jgi:predicted secreted protein
MNIVGGIIIYLLLWWCVFFAVLPMGVSGRWESEPDGVAGAEPGAPSAPDLKKKFLLTSAIAAGLWVVVAAIIVSGVINFRD